MRNLSKSKLETRSNNPYYQEFSFSELKMADLSASDLISLIAAAGTIGTLLVIFYFSRKGMQTVSTDIETKVLNDLDEKMHGLAEMLVHRPELIKVISKDLSSISPELVFAYYTLYMCAHAFHMHQRKILSDNEWTGWLRWMKSAFAEGAIGEYWEKTIHPEKWFDPDFQNFINNEIIKK
jgi:hypothetical protein